MKKFKYIFLFILFFILIFTINSNSYAFSLDNTYLQNGCPDNVVDFVLSSSFYKENNYTGFFIFDYSKYSNSYQVIMFYDNFSINFKNNYTINESYKSGSSKKTFGVMGVKKDTFDILFTSPGHTSYSENMTLKNYFFTGVNSSLSIDNSLAITTSSVQHSPDYNITLSTTEKTSDPIIAYSNYFDIEDFDKYKCYISKDGNNWDELKNISTNTNNGISQYRYFYYILENGTYYFKFLNTETEKVEKLITKTITNISYTISDKNYKDNGIPQPHITFKKLDDHFSLRTQTFNKDEINKYQCFYTSDPTNFDYSTWNSCSIGTTTNTATNETEFYFFTNLPIDSKDCTFGFVFYDTELKKYGYITTYTCDIDYMLEQSEKVDGDKKTSKINQLINFFKERFGFLTYPFEFISDFFDRVLNINYSEPIIKIPELKDPFYNNTIFNGVEFNFNSLLENNIYLYLHNIYLVVVDFIFIFGFIKGSFAIFMEVLANG